jgi:hypothetical protein
MKLPAAIALLALAAAAAETARHAVAISVENDRRVIQSNGLPDHAPGRFPRRGNPNTISAQNHVFRVPLAPAVAAQTTPARGAWFGVALNGVPFEAGTGEFWNGRREWNYEAMTGHLDLGLDEHHAHVQPSGAYHYHGLPTGLVQRLGGDTGQTMRLVGYAADGFPIYTAWAHREAGNAASALRPMKSSWRLRPGTRPGGGEGPGGRYDGTFTADYEFAPGSGDLDECNGRTGVTPEYPAGTYYYCITAEFPFLPRDWRGTPDASFFKRGPGPGPGGRRGPDGRPGPPRDFGFPPPPR